MKIILVIICWEHDCFCKLDSFLKLTYCVDIEGFRISLCLHFTCLHNQTWTPLRHICWTILVYKTLKICNLFNTLCAIILIFIQESMNRVHDLIVKLRNCKLNFKVWFDIIDTPVLPNQQASTFSWDYYIELINISLWLRMSSACILMLNLKFFHWPSGSAYASASTCRSPSMEDKGCQC